MIIRDYTATDEQACLDIFDSNCPQYFAPAERLYLERWLKHQGAQPKTSTYQNAAVDHYYVLELDGEVRGCGGFYITSDGKHAKITWGMVHHQYHKKGLGTALYNYRKEIIEQLYPQATLVLDTSQHTFGFFEKMGHNITKITKDGYGAGLDRYDME